MNVATSPLSYYLSLQHRRAHRTLDDNGIYPWLALPLVLAVFAFLSFRLLNGYAFGEYIYAGLGISLSSSIADDRRYDFIKSISSRRDFRIIRLAEQFILLFPFTIGLFLFGWTLAALILLLFGILFSFINLNVRLPYSLPTPFGRRPFEFAKGYRGAVLFIIGCYLLVPIGISEDNFNLSLASIAGIGLVSGNYFIQPEPRFYIWIHTMGPLNFLMEKTKTILYYSLLTIAPIAIILSFYNPSRIGSIALMILAAIAFTEICMLAKYLAYPSEVNIIAGLAMAGSILFPPLMLVIIPIFYLKAYRRLDEYLR